MTSPQIADTLVWKYRVALAVVAALVLGNEALLQPYMTRLTTDAPLINTAGRQRMLSQRSGEGGPGLGGGQRRAAHGLISKKWSRCSHSGRRLTSNFGRARADEANRGTVSDGVRDGLEGLEPSFARMQIRGAPGDRGRGERIGRDVAALQAGLAAILDNEAEYLEPDGPSGRAV